MAGVVLVTGVGRYLGTALAARLSADASIERIIGVDTIVPRSAGRLGRTEFVRADIGHPLIAKVLDQARVDTIVHPRVLGRRRTVTASLLEAAQRARSLHRFVAESSTAVYPATRSTPAVCTEELPTDTAVDGTEAQLRTFARRRPDVAVSVLRLAEIVGPAVDTWLTRYLTLPVVPTALGFDPRLQVLHESDAVEALARAVIEPDAGGVINVAAPGVVSLAQALRWAGRPRVPVPGAVLAAMRYDLAVLRYGRVVDTSRLAERLRYEPRYTSAEALRSFFDERAVLPRVQGPALAAVGLARNALQSR